MSFPFAQAYSNQTVNVNPRRCPLCQAMAASFASLVKPEQPGAEAVQRGPQSGGRSGGWVREAVCWYYSCHCTENTTIPCLPHHRRRNHGNNDHGDDSTAAAATSHNHFLLLLQLLQELLLLFVRLLVLRDKITTYDYCHRHCHYHYHILLLPILLLLLPQTTSTSLPLQ